MIPRPFLLAIQFLTIFPVRSLEAVKEQDVGNSLLYYPIIGLIIGIVLLGLAWSMGSTDHLITAAVLLMVWVLLTGALHLDGLADSADAWLGGVGDRQRTLAIMKDPASGPAAVVCLILVLLVKFTTIAHFLAQGNWMILLLAPVLGRTSVIVLLLSTPYVRPQGIGSQLVDHMPRIACKRIVILTLIATLLFFGFNMVWLLVILSGLFMLLRKQLLQRLGGTTGDTTGALVELTAPAVLVSAIYLL